MLKRTPLILVGASLAGLAFACSSTTGANGARPGSGAGPAPAGAETVPGGGPADAATGADPGAGATFDSGSGAAEASGGANVPAPAAMVLDAGIAGATPAANLPTGVPAGYKLLLDQSFASPGSLGAIRAGNPQDWTHGAEDGGFLQYGGVGYTPPNPPIPESFTSFALISAMKFGSFVMEVELMQRNPNQGIPQRDMCIVFGIRSETEYYYAHIAQGHTDRWHNIHIINNAPRRPITTTDNGGIRWGLNQWQKVRVVRDVAAGTIAVYLNGDLATPILTATDTTFGEGYVGFATHQDSGRVRNLKVWGASATAEPAPPGFFR